MCVRAWKFTTDRDREREVRDTLHTYIHCASKRIVVSRTKMCWRTTLTSLATVRVAMPPKKPAIPTRGAEQTHQPKKIPKTHHQIDPANMN